MGHEDMMLLHDLDIFKKPLTGLEQVEHFQDESKFLKNLV